MSKVTLNDINVSYDGKTQILKGLNLEIGEGELVSLLGLPGVGKQRHCGSSPGSSFPAAVSCLSIPRK